MKPKVLLVDDEPNVLNSYGRGLRKNWDLITALSGEEGLAAIEEQGPFAVIIADFCMPCMDGIAFLVKSMEISPESVRMILTGEGDFHVATKAVNEGNIFRFITKPCPLEQLEKALQDGYRQFRLLQIEKEARHQELAIAGEIQKTLLMENVPTGLNSIDIAAIAIPSKDSDGDFVDFFKFDENKFDLVVGDAMGKGLHAAMVGAGAKNQLSRILWQLSLKNDATVLEPASVMETLKQALEPGLTQIETYITMIYARFNMPAQEMRFVDAGHTPILWYSTQQDSWHELKGSGVPVGLPTQRAFEQRTIYFTAGDIFLFYSDGLWDGRSPDKEPYGARALLRCIDTLRDKSAEEFISALLEDHKKFIAAEHFFDDLTIIVVKILPPQTCKS